MPASRAVNGTPVPAGLIYVASWRRVSDRALLNASILSYNSDRGTDGFVLVHPGVRVDKMLRGSSSGIPVGFHSVWQLEDGKLVQCSTTRFEEIQLSLLSQGSDAEGYYRAPNRDWRADQQLCEQFMRRSLARAAGRRLGGLATSSMAGASIPTATCGRSNAKFGDLRAWCSAKDWTVTENKDLGVLTVKRGSTFAVVPMGTAWVKWDGATWTKMSDVVMEKDGRVMAPKDALDRLNTL
jgi:hypothetical protein